MDWEVKKDRICGNLTGIDEEKGFMYPIPKNWD